MTRTHLFSLLAVPIALMSCSTTANKRADTPGAAAPMSATASAPAPPPAMVIPAGSTVSVRLLNAVASNMNAPGSPVAAELTAPLVVNGVTVARRGSQVTGVVSDSNPGGRVKGVAHISLRLTELRLDNGRTVNLSTDTPTFYARATKKRDAIAIGVTSGIGSVIGALAGGGKGAAIGAGAGAGAGTAGVLATHGAPAVVSAESVVQFRLRNAITL